MEMFVKTEKHLFFRPRVLVDESVAYDIIRWVYANGKTKPVVLGSLNPTTHPKGVVPAELLAKLTESEQAEASAFWSANYAAIEAERAETEQKASPTAVADAVAIAVAALEAGVLTGKQVAALIETAAALTKTAKKVLKAGAVAAPTEAPAEAPKATEPTTHDLFSQAQAAPDAEHEAEPTVVPVQDGVAGQSATL